MTSRCNTEEEREANLEYAESELSELNDTKMEEIAKSFAEKQGGKKEKQRKEKNTSQPNFPRADPSKWVEQSTQEFFRCDNRNRDEDVFNMPAKGPVRGALVSALATVAGGGIDLMPKIAEEAEGEREGEGSKREEGMSMAEDDEMDCTVASPDRPSMPTPIPARLGTPTSVLVTPGKGNKMRAITVGTPRPSQGMLPARKRVGGTPTQGWISRGALTEVLAAIVVAKKRMEEKAVKREEKAEEREMWAGAREKMAREQEEHLVAGMAVMEKKLQGTLKAMVEEAANRAHWEIGQWKGLEEGMEAIRVSIAEVGGRVEAEGKVAATWDRAGAPAVATAVTAPPAAPRHRKQQQKAWVTAKPRLVTTLSHRAAESEATEGMQGVVLTEKRQVEESEEFSDMEGVEQEGLYTSCYAPAGNEYESFALQKTGEEVGNGKGKKIMTVVLRSILKRPEAVAAEKAAGKRRL